VITGVRERLGHAGAEDDLASVGFEDDLAAAFGSRRARLSKLGLN
jgi:hypothetical protein